MFLTFSMKELSLLNIQVRQKRLMAVNILHAQIQKEFLPNRWFSEEHHSKLYNNIVVSDDDEDEDEPEVDDLFLNGDDEETLPDFENIENLNEEEE